MLPRTTRCDLPVRVALSHAAMCVCATTWSGADQLLYPHDAQSQTVGDAELAALLGQLQLSYLMSYEGA